MPDRVVILGVPIDAVTANEAVERIKMMLAEEKHHHVMTPNSEMLVEASQNKAFHDLLSRTALNLPDSIGLVKAAHLPERVTGIDTVMTLSLQLDRHQSVFLLGAAEGVAEKAAQVLQESNPNLKIVGTYSGCPSKEDAALIIEKINTAKPHLLLVAFGAPIQDLWIDKHLKGMPSVRVAMGVGGTFDFIAGVRKRAPKLFQSLGIEWLWRLIKEPRRIGRIFNAVGRFPLLVWRFGTKSPH